MFRAFFVGGKGEKKKEPQCLHIVLEWGGEEHPKGSDFLSINTKDQLGVAFCSHTAPSLGFADQKSKAMLA
jgi:hypothetical protein